MRAIRWLPLALIALPLAATMWLGLASLGLGIWAVSQLRDAQREHSPYALAAAVATGAKSARAASWITSGWGLAAPIVPPLARSAEVGQILGELADAASAVAPGIPAALGYDGSRSYLIATLNDAELFGSGGAPLNGLVVKMQQGDPSIPVSGSVSMGLNPGNARYPWDVAGGLPWYRTGRKYPFANSNFHPDFRISGRNMVVAWNALDPNQVQGVITVDVAAVAAVLGAVGPVTTKAYGEVTAENVAQTLLVDAYRQYPDWPVESILARQGANAELQAALIDRLREPRMALRAARALWDVIPARHVQVFMVDPELQAGVAAIGANGALSRPSRDVLGVFLQSAPSKIAIFQQEHIQRQVTVRPDGSASVRQLVTCTNAIPPDVKGDEAATRGYLALTYRSRVAYRIPPTAREATVRVVGREPLVLPSGTGPFPDSVGAQVLWQGQDVPPRESSQTEVTYELPPGTFGGPEGLTYTLDADVQPIMQPPTVELSVTFPEGASPRGQQEGWVVEGTTATWTGTLDRPLQLGVTD